MTMPQEGQPQEEPPQDQPAAGPTISTAPPRARWQWGSIPSHVGPARTSTVILAVLFLAIGVLYLNVRPETTGTTSRGSGTGVESPAPQRTTVAPTTAVPATTTPVPTTATEEPTTEPTATSEPTTTVPEETTTAVPTTTPPPSTFAPTVTTGGTPTS